MACQLRNSKLDFQVPTGAQRLGFPEVLGQQNRTPGEPETSVAGRIAEVLVETLHTLTDRKVDSSKHFSKILKRRKIPQFLTVSR